MVDINGISKNLVNQFDLLKTDITQATERFKDVEFYINCRIKKLKRLIPVIEKTKSFEKLSAVIDLFGEVRAVLEKMDELEGSINKIKEVPIEIETEMINFPAQELTEND